MTRTIFSSFVILASLGALMPEAKAQGVCWDGSFVRDLKDCPRRPGKGKLLDPGSGRKSSLPAFGRKAGNENDGTASAGRTNRRGKLGGGGRTQRSKQFQLLPPW